MTGVHPAPDTDKTAPPAGWFWDDARGLLAPTDGDMLALLATMEWAIAPLPGVNSAAALQGIACLDTSDDSARLEALTVAHSGQGRAALEANGAVWLILPHELEWAVDEAQWDRARRYMLDDVLIPDVTFPEALRA